MSTRVKGKLHTWSGTKKKTFAGLFVGINPNNFVKNYPFFKTNGLFYEKSLSSFTGNIFHVSKKESLGSEASELVLG